jgi:hypothetical protein
MPPADAPDARPHERALAEDLTGASLLRTRNVDNTEKRVEKAETRSETRSAAARPWSAPDAQEPPPARMRAKHASTRRPGAILRAAERLVLAAAVEDAAVSDAIENDGSLDQPPGGSDDTRIEAAAFREPDVFDALFLREKEKETDGETNAPWWSKMVPVDLPGSESVVDLDLACLSNVSKEDETFDRRVAPPPSADTRNEEEARPDAGRKKKKAAALAFSETNEDTNDPSMPLDADLARAFARLRVAVDGAKAKARAARERLANRLKNLINDDARASAALRGVGVDPWLAEEALATRADARAIQARAALDARRRAYHARCDAPDSGGSPLNPARGTRRAGTAKPSSLPAPCEPGSALVKFNAQSRRTQPLRDFLVAHFDHPYPSDAQRERLARASGMSRAQVGNWFINARVRIWRPMILRLGEQIEDERREDQTRGARGGRVNGSRTIKKTNAVSKWNARSGDEKKKTMA